MVDRSSPKGTAQAPLAHYMAEFLSGRSELDGASLDVFSSVVSRLTTSQLEGHICIELDQQEEDVMRKSPLVFIGDSDTSAPLVLSGTMLYFGRYYQYECSLADSLVRLSSVCYEHKNLADLLDHFFPVPPGGIDYQREAAGTALGSSLCIIGGGPGTGKTTTIVRIVGLLLSCYGAEMKIALAAPTGKAAMRMIESINQQRLNLDFGPEVQALFPDEAMTLHRLLGLGRFSRTPKYHKHNPMNWDVVIVDEASMVDLALMCKLTEALKQGGRLILIGDKNQLASVESGAVLADCMDVLKKQVTELQTTYRFNHDISALADAIKVGDGDKAWSLARQDGSSILGVVSEKGGDWIEPIGQRYAEFLKRVARSAGPDDYQQLFSQLSSFRVLCALKQGAFGVEEINNRVERYLARNGFECDRSHWYAGRPVMVTRNDYSLDLFNGDIGICLPDPELLGELSVWFETGDGRLRSYPPSRLPTCETVWAMTIHKSQGSEFDEIFIVLPQSDNRVLCRELLYTSVTRARNKISFVMDEQICKVAVERKTIRYSGLSRRLHYCLNSFKKDIQE